MEEEKQIEDQFIELTKDMLHLDSDNALQVALKSITFMMTVQDTMNSSEDLDKEYIVNNVPTDVLFDATLMYVHAKMHEMSRKIELGDLN